MSEARLTIPSPNLIQTANTFTGYELYNAINAQFIINYINDGKNFYSKDVSLDGPKDHSEDKRKEAYQEKIEDFIAIFSNSNPQVFAFDSLNSYSLNFGNIIVNFTLSQNTRKIFVSMRGDKEEIEKFTTVLYEHFEKYTEEQLCMIDWCFTDDNHKMAKVRKELEVKNVPFTEMYPFLNGESLEDYYERYNSSSASILLLQGPPGTGKTTFIRGLLSHCKKNSILSYDDAILNSDNFLSSFIDDSSVNYLIFEDADAYLTSRESGNRTIHKFLNAGDGLISSSDKKIIFTTNLASLSDVDQALIRPGRCFDVLQFRQLTKDEAIAVAEKQGVEVELPEKNFTIAEIFNSQKNTKKKEARAIGFAM
jgi:SpoVK/Ycf46/Vps4 family AAA+-type ATPase